MMKKYDWGKMTWREIDAVIQLEIFETPVYRTDKDFYYVVDIEDASVDNIPKLKPVPHYSRNIVDTMRLLDKLNGLYFYKLYSAGQFVCEYELVIMDDFDKVLASARDMSILGVVVKCVCNLINEKNVNNRE